MKFLLEMFPLAAFFIAYNREGLMTATLVLMIATAISIGIIYLKYRKIPLNPLISAVLIGVFGGLTLFFNDDTFIKIKPTIINLLFAAILLIGVKIGKPPLKYMMQMAMQLTEQGWRKLSINWAFFFMFLAGLNEYIWRSYPEDFWVNFKVFGMLPLTIVFLLTQVPLIKRYMIDDHKQD